MDKLKTDIPELHVDDYPAKPAEYKLDHPIGAVLLLYNGGKFSEPFALVKTVQDEYHQFITEIKARSLGGPDGALTWIMRVFESLQENKFTGCLPTYIVDIAEAIEENGVWSYGLIWKINIKLQ